MLHHVLTKGGIRVSPPAHLGLPPRELAPSASGSSLSSLPSLSTSLLPPSSLSDLTSDPLTRPPPQLTTSTSPQSPFDALLSETRRMIAGPDFARVLELCLDRATEVLFAGLERSVFRDITAPSTTLPSAEGMGAKIEEIKDEDALRVRLAGMLPGLARWSNLALTSLPNELIDVGYFISSFDLSLMLFLANRQRARGHHPFCHHLRGL
jgi:peroxin-3